MFVDDVFAVLFFGRIKTKIENKILYTHRHHVWNLFFFFRFFVVVKWHTIKTTQESEKKHCACNCECCWQLALDVVFLLLSLCRSIWYVSRTYTVCVPATDSTVLSDATAIYRNLVLIGLVLLNQIHINENIAQRLPLFTFEFMNWIRCINIGFFSLLLSLFRGDYNIIKIVVFSMNNFKFAKSERLSKRFLSVRIEWIASTSAVMSHRTQK